MFDCTNYLVIEGMLLLEKSINKSILHPFDQARIDDIFIGLHNAGYELNPNEIEQIALVLKYDEGMAKYFKEVAIRVNKRRMNKHRANKIYSKNTNIEEFLKKRTNEKGRLKIN